MDIRHRNRFPVTMPCTCSLLVCVACHSENSSVGLSGSDSFSQQRGLQRLLQIFFILILLLIDALIVPNVLITSVVVFDTWSSAGINLSDSQIHYHFQSDKQNKLQQTTIAV